MMTPSAQPQPGVATILGTLLWAMSIAAFQAALWLVLLVLLLHCVWSLESVLSESDAKLPIMSQQLILLSYWARSYWYLLVLFGLPLAIVEISVVVIARLRQNIWLSALHYVCIAVGSLVPLALLLFSMPALAMTIFVATRALGT